jgi:signal transduction histidine kinase/ligand-binding sensor domain-containing protein
LKIKIVLSTIVIRTSFLSLLLLCASSIFSQEAVRFFTVKQGLTQNSVTTILRSKDGMLWVGTQDGLNRFDGYSFTHFRHDPDDSLSISDQYITAIHEDNRGNLWVGTRHGLNLFDKKNGTFTRIYPDQKSKNKVQSQTHSIAGMNDKQVIASIATNVYRLDMPKRKTVQLNTGPIDQDNIAFVKGRIWHVWDRGHVCNIEDCGSPNHQQVKKRSDAALLTDLVYADHQARLWHLSLQENQSMISIYDTRIKEWESKFIEVPVRINHLAFDRDNQPWIATEDGIFTINGSGKAIPFKAGNKKFNGKLLFMYPDQEGLIWMGYADKGLAKYNPAANLFRLETNDAENKTIFTSHELADGTLLMGGAFGAVLQRQNKWENFYQSKVSSSTVDEKGNIWLGTPGQGIVVMDKNKKLLARYSKEGKHIASNDVFHLQHDQRSARIFAATKLGLSVFDEKTSRWFMLNNGENIKGSLPLTGTYVMHTMSDDKGFTWISTNGGIDVLDPQLKLVKQFNSDTDTSIIKRTIITSVAEDLKGNKWFATLSNGLYHYDGKHIQHYGIKEGLGSNICYGAVADQKGRIWISTSAGINMLDPVSKRITSFGEDDGMANSDYTISSTRITPKGFVHIGSTDGLVIVDPSTFKEDNRQLKVYLDHVMANYVPKSIDTAYQFLPDSKVVSFSFSAPTFINADKVIYQYRLKGFDNNWVTFKANNRMVSFTNLPYRNLTLELRASQNLYTIEDAPITAVPIDVLPPFWRKPIFLIPALLLMLAGIFIAIRMYFQRKIENGKRKAEIEQTIYKERERISRDLHDRLGAYAAAIKNNVVRIEKADNIVTDQLQQLKENAEEMVMALRETIWALQLSGVSTINLSDRFKSLVNRIAINYPDIKIGFTEDIQLDNELSPNEGIQLMRIMQEALTNSLKHSNADAIQIHVVSDKDVRVTITDNGRGFDPTGLRQGQGLQNMRQRSEEAGFVFSITSNEKGTTVFVSTVV